MTHRLFIATALIMIAAGCGAPPSVDVAVETPSEPDDLVRFTARSFSAESEGCNEDGRHCARIDVTTLATAGGGTELVRDNIDLYVLHDLVSRLRALVPEEDGNKFTSPDDLADAFIAEHRAFTIEFPDATAAWFVEINTVPVFSTPDVCTVNITETAYTGGAHPNTRQRLVSFDVATGQLLGVDDLSTDPAALTAIVERHLRTDHELGPDGDLVAAGFWIPEEGLGMPDTIGVVEEGLLIHWDPYEIAPYSMGPIDVTIPASELDGVVEGRYW